MSKGEYIEVLFSEKKMNTSLHIFETIKTGTRSGCVVSLKLSKKLPVYPMFTPARKNPCKRSICKGFRSKPVIPLGLIFMLSNSIEFHATLVA